jgi:hypothetical protein
MISVLAISEQSPGEYLTHWQRLEGVPDTDAAYLLLRPVFPEHCRFEPPRLSCGARGLVGRLGFLGLDALSSSAVMQIESSALRNESYAFSSALPQIVRHGTARAASRVALLKSFVAMGIEHIFLGWDHLAFVLGLLWLVRSKIMLIKTISAFTLGHSVTLAAASLGHVHVPGPPVEAVIALSIAFVAMEVIKGERASGVTLTRRAPWLVALGFGLLHGLGFASALREAEITPAELPLSLLGFNLGVELGQLAFVAGVLACSALFERVGSGVLPRLRSIAYYFVGGLAMYWFVARVAAFAQP